MLKILQAKLQEYMNWELPDVQAGFRKGRGTRYQIANIHLIIAKAREFQKNIYFCFIDYAKAFDCGSEQTVENSSRDGNTSPPYLPPEKPVHRSRSNRTGNRTKDKFKIGKGVYQGWILSPCLFNLYAGCIMWNSGLDEAQAGIKISGRNINNLRYAGDTTRMAESEEELRSLLMKVKKESWLKWKSWLKTQHSENYDHGIQPHHFMANRWGNSRNSDRLFGGGWWLQPWN